MFTCFDVRTPLPIDVREYFIYSADAWTFLVPRSKSSGSKTSRMPRGAGYKAFEALKRKRSQQMQQRNQMGGIRGVIMIDNNVHCS